MKSFALFTALLAAVPLFAQAKTSPAKAKAVREAVTRTDKVNALEDEDFVFDFKDPELKATGGSGGKSISANVGNFAALVGNGLALTMGYMEPCGANSPHTHPRASEIMLLLNGSVSSGFLTENGSRFVTHNLTELNAMVFPAGSIHFQMNYGCEPAQWVAALSNEDPGTLQIAQRFFAMPADVVGAALGGLGVEDVEHLSSLIPDNMIAGTKECYQRCGIPYPDTQSKKQQQKPKPVPTEQKPGEDKPAEDKPKDDKPNHDKPKGDKPAEDKPAEDDKTMHPDPAKTIDVSVGKNGTLIFKPDDIKAKVGDIIVFHFESGNNTVTQSSFEKPCEPLGEGGFNSGFQPINPESKTEKVYQLVVFDENPIWLFSNQAKDDSGKTACEQGMRGVINPPKDTAKTLAAFKTHVPQ